MAACLSDGVWAVQLRFALNPPNQDPESFLSGDRTRDVGVLPGSPDGGRALARGPEHHVLHPRPEVQRAHLGPFQRLRYQHLYAVFMLYNLGFRV